MDSSTRLQRYAELVVKVGAAVRPGTVVNLTCALEHVDLAREVVEQA